MITPVCGHLDSSNRISNDLSSFFTFINFRLFEIFISSFTLAIGEIKIVICGQQITENSLRPKCTSGQERIPTTCVDPQRLRCSNCLRVISVTRRIRARSRFTEHLYDGRVWFWIILYKEHIHKDFELILIMEHYDISLAVMVLKLCWDIDDAIYLKVNAQPKQKGKAVKQNHQCLSLHFLFRVLRKYFRKFGSLIGLTLSKQAKKTLYTLNEPDYVLYDHFNKTLWETVDELGRERVQVRDPPIDGPFCPDHQVSPNDWWIPN